MNSKLEGLNIAFDTKRLFSNVTGLGTYARAFIWEFKRLFPKSIIHLYTNHGTLSTVRSDIQYLLDDPQIRIHAYNGKWPNLWRNKTIVKDLIKDQIDLYFGLSNELPWGIHQTNIRTIVIIHDLIHRIIPQDFYPWDRLIYRIKTQYAVQQGDHIICVSQNTRNDLKAHYGKLVYDKSTVIHPFLNPIFSKHSQYQLPPTIQKNPYLLYVGSCQPRKNVSFLLDVMEVYRITYGDHKLIIITPDDRHSQKIKTEAASKKLTRHVEVIHGVEDNQLPQYFQNAICLLYPSLYEGFGLPILEAIACGCPVFAMDGSSLREAGLGQAVHLEMKPKLWIDAIQNTLCNTHKIQPTKNRSLIDEYSKHQRDTLIKLLLEI